MWLWVSSGIVLPILLHLARGRSGKTLKIGSIHLLRENIISQSSSLKIRERLLLLLRCLGIILASLLLSSPHWKDFLRYNGHSGWVMLEKGMGASLSDEYLQRINSLRQVGYELHLLEDGFPKADIKDLRILASDGSNNKLPTYWELLQKLGQQIPAHMPVYVFSGNKLNRFSGDRPALALNLHWIPIESSDTVYSWISSVYATGPDSFRVINGNSRSTRSWFKNEEISKNAYRLLPAVDHPVPDTGEMKISVFSPSGYMDDRYLLSALDAVQHYSGHKIKIFHTHSEDSLPSKSDWIFWLSETPLPGRLESKNTFKYNAGLPERISSRIYPINESRDPLASIYLLTESADKTSQILWTDGFGRPMLTVDKQNHYLIYSHIDPAWNDLPWSDWFPQFILDLLYPENMSSRDLANDRRKIDNRQALPEMLSMDTTRSSIKFQVTDLSMPCWILLLIIFSTERILSLKKRKSIHA